MLQCPPCHALDRLVALCAARLACEQATDGGAGRHLRVWRGEQHSQRAGTALFSARVPVTPYLSCVIRSPRITQVGAARDLAEVVRRELKEIVHMLCGHRTASGSGKGATLGSVALSGLFPKVIKCAPREDDEESDKRALPGVSVHLCCSDTRRIAPDPSREVVVWLTLVDLQQFNPVHASQGYADSTRVVDAPRLATSGLRAERIALESRGGQWAADTTARAL